MQTVFKFCVFFALGFCGAIVFAFSGAALPFAQMLGWARPAGRVGELVVTVREQNPLVVQYNADERLDGLRVALRKGTPRALGLVRDEFISALSKSPDEVLPVVQSEALEAFLTRFTDADWDGWPRARTLLGGGPTLARTYVDDVANVNADLGSFLESSGLLLYGLSQATRRGAAFDQQQFLEEQSRRSGERSGDKLAASIDPKIIKKPAFITIFERERARLVRHYIFQHPDDVRTNIRLLDSVSTSNVNSEFYETLNRQLAFLARSVTPVYRKEFLVSELQERRLRRFEEASAGVRAASAKVFLLGAVDAVNRGEIDFASTLLTEGRHIDEAVGEYDLVRNLIADERERIERARIAEAEAMAVADAELAGENFSDLANRPGTTKLAHVGRTVADGLISILFVMSIVVLPLFAIYLVRRSRSSEKETKVLPAPPQRPRKVANA